MLLIMAACGENTATPVPPAAPVPPTSTLGPTATPVPPTATSAPTATPVPPTATPIPPTTIPVPLTATPVPPTATPVPPVVKNSAFNSRGLGLDKADWEAIYGKPENKGGTDWYQNLNFTIIFYSDRVWNLNRQYRGNPESITVAKAEAKLLSPTDAKFIKTYTSRTGSPVDLFLSQSLKDRFQFPNNNWSGGVPGNFIVIYHPVTNSSNQISSFVMGTGNNP